MIRPTFSFQWHLLDDCDQRCKHCYIFSGDESVKLSRMSFDQMRRTLANIEDFCEAFGRDPYLYITGGDPILHPDFWRLMDLLKEKGVKFTIMGNPFHLTDEACERMRQSGCLRYQMSIDGNRETHDWFRKPGSYDETFARIPMLARHGIRSIIMTTVSDVNASELPQIIDAVVEANVNVFAFSRYVPTPGENMKGLSSLEYRAVLDAAHKKFVEYEKAGCETYFNRKDHLWRLYEWEEGLWSIPEDAKKGMIYEGCNCGSGHLTILPTGDVYACRRVADSKVGNAFTDRLADIWLGPMEDYRQVEKFSKCSRCELLAWCRGCPAVARGTDGNFYGEDPQCWHEVSEQAESDVTRGRSICHPLVTDATSPCHASPCQKTMKALVIHDVTPAQEATLSEVAIPETKPGWTLVRVRGFGMNHSEQVLRLDEIRESYIKHPIIPGIELVGEVANPSDSGLATGQRVCALMGGMGRGWDGSYAEYCLVRNDRLFPVPHQADSLPWSKLAAIPETFFTAWGSLFECLRLEPNDKLLIRGASCGLGYAAIQLARAFGCKVIATTHREKYRADLERVGADEVCLDQAGMLDGYGIEADKVLELIGPRRCSTRSGC